MWHQGHAFKVQAHQSAAFSGCLIRLLADRFIALAIGATGNTGEHQKADTITNDLQTAPATGAPVNLFLPEPPLLLAPASSKRAPTVLRLPIQLHSSAQTALLDPGSADNIIHDRLAASLRLQRFPLLHPVPYQTIDGRSEVTTEYTMVPVQIGALLVKLAFHIMAIPEYIILGFAFLRFFRVVANWTTQVVTLSYKGQFEVNAEVAHRLHSLFATEREVLLS